MACSNDKKIYAIIPAGGRGHRMGSRVPKQFLRLGGRSILSYSVEVICSVNEVFRTIILTPSDYIEMAKKALLCDIPHITDYDVIEGGSLRNDTIMNGIRHIKENYPYDENTVVLTHDAVRPFVTQKIIKDNIMTMDKYVACNTVIPVTDTIVESYDKLLVSNVPNRANLYNVQTPQTFNMIRFENLYNEFSDDQKKTFTDAITVFVASDEKVAMVLGDHKNLKITHPFDLDVAETIVSNT